MGRLGPLYYSHSLVWVGRGGVYSSVCRGQQAHGGGAWDLIRVEAQGQHVRTCTHDGGGWSAGGTFEAHACASGSRCRGSTGR